MRASPLASSRFVVAIPVCNEVARIEACLRALSDQRGGRCDHVVLLLNNCTDGTAREVERVRPALAMPLTVAVRDFPAGQADAGHARSAALALAAQVAGPDGIVATTDADGVVAVDWVACTRAALALGVEAVCGRALIDPVEAMRIPRALHDDDAREVGYGAMLDEIHALADPDRWDPLPRHTEHSGASIAVTVAAYGRAGGMIPLPTGEDRAFLRALRAIDARIRHAPDVRVTVSGRLEGRAAGGMADTMARRMICQDTTLDAELEPAAICLRRARLRARARALWEARHAPDAAWHARSALLAGAASLPTDTVRTWLRHRHFGTAWNRIEAESPALVRVPVARQALDRHVAEAGRILAGLRNGLPADAADPVGSPAAAEACSA